MACSNTNPQILDVRVPDRGRGAVGAGDMSEQIITGLLKPTGKKTVPTMLLYDERGLRLYDAITTDCPEYYLFASEENILKNNADQIVTLMHYRDTEAGSRVNSVVLELGAG